MGMSKRIGRRIRENTCHCVILDDDNNISRVDVILYGEYGNETRRENAVRKKLQRKRFMIESMDTRDMYVSMPVEKFIEDADQITER